MKIRGQTVFPAEERLKRMTSVDDATGCHNWTGSKTNGYGRLIIGSRTDGSRRTISAHRLAFESFRGPIPAGMEVCHKCDNPSCINPNHLFVGTKQDNMDDRDAKGRNKVQVGEKNGQAKLTEADVRSIRRLRSIGHTYKSIASRFGVDKMTVLRAAKGEQWAHVCPAAPANGEVKS